MTPDDLRLLSEGQLHAHTLDALRKLHEVVTFPGGSLPVDSAERIEFELAWTLRAEKAKHVLAEWDRRLPLMHERHRNAKRILKGGKAS